jgi:hypothetical protein
LTAGRFSAFSQVAPNNKTEVANMSRASMLAALVLLSACADTEPTPTAIAAAPVGPSSVVVPGSGTYTQLASMPTARYQATGATLRGRLYVAGGINVSFNHSTAVERYNPLDNSWAAVAPLPVGLAGHAMVAADDRLFVSGGSTSSAFATNTLYASDRLVTGWTAIGALPSTRAYHAMIAVGGKLYVIGGQKLDFSVASELDIYDIETGEWSSGASIPIPGAAPTGVTLLVGRTIHFLSYVGNYLIYDIDADAWTTRPTGSIALAGTVGGAVDGRVYQLSRTGANTQTLGYDPATPNETTSLLTPPDASNFKESAFATIGNKIYSAGGLLTPSGSTSSALWMFKPAFADNHIPYVNTNGPYRALEGSAIPFSAVASDLDDDDLTYYWEFGDESFSLSQSGVKSYRDNGEFTVTLYVGDGQGGLRVKTTRATIRNVKPTVTGINKATFSAGNTYSATGTITDPGLDDTFTATVDWGEGSGPASLPVTDNSISLNHVYATPGYYNLVVKVTDDDGATATISRWIRVKPGD